MKSSTYCVMPHIGIALQNEGDVCACNNNTLSYKINDEKKFTIDKYPINLAWQSPTRQILIENLDNGVQHDSCKSCWDLENAGKVSPRQTFNKLFDTHKPESSQPLVMVIKPGNTCDGACRICNPETSSGWYKDEFKLQQQKNPNLEYKEYIKSFEIIKNSFSPTNSNFWPIMQQWSSKLKFVDVYGGEPWLIKGLWKTFDNISQQGYAQDMSISIHTNLSNCNLEYIDTLSKFKKVWLSISIDSHIPEHFEYQRYPLKYETCIETAKKYINYAKKYQNISMKVTCTISSLNVWDIENIHTALSHMLGIKITIDNFVTNSGYDIRHLPKKIKQDLIHKLQNYEPAEPIVNFLKQTIPGCVIYWPKFVLTTEKLDSVRKQSFHKTFPEWSEKLKPYWDYKKPHQEWF